MSYEFAPAGFFPLSIAEREAAVMRMDKSAAALRDRLLALGGKRVVWHLCESRTALLAAEGRSFPADRALLKKGKPSMCHESVEALPIDQQVTGYALSDDGLWRQHSWGWDGKRVIETTERRVAYFGVFKSMWTPAMLDQAWKAQGGKCAICQKPLASKKEAQADQDPETGRPRALLCRTCKDAVDGLELTTRS